MEQAHEVLALRDLYERAEFNHAFKNDKDYLQEPKEDGYRGLHLIYRYRGTQNTNCYDNLQIEIQMRSQLQHAWATAVEAVGTFTRQALKWRGGDADWRRFFALMGSAIAKIEEFPLVPDTPTTKRALGSEIRNYSDELRVRETLRAYNLTLNYVGEIKGSDAKILLVHMKPDFSQVQVEGFRLRDSQQANVRYTELEQRLEGAAGEQAVLVRVESLQALQRAYPNYFLDTERFSDILRDVLTWR